MERTEMTVLEQGSTRQVYLGVHEIPDHFPKDTEEFQRQSLEGRSEVDFLPKYTQSPGFHPSNLLEKKKEKLLHSHIHVHFNWSGYLSRKLNVRDRTGGLT